MSVATQAVPLSGSVTLTTDPLGAEVAVRVDDAPAPSVRDAVVDEIERTLVGERGNAVFETVQEAHANLRAYGSRHDYEVAEVIDAFDGVDATRDRTSVSASIAWSGDVPAFYEFGTTAHTVDGTGVLAFIWADAPAGVQEQFSQARGPDGQFQSGTQVFFDEVEVAGLPEGRWLRDALNGLRRRLS